VRHVAGEPQRADPGQLAGERGTSVTASPAATSQRMASVSRGMQTMSGSKPAATRAR
jgi:hypothetical protein